MSIIPMIGNSIERVCSCDSSLYKLKFTQTCFDALLNLNIPGQADSANSSNFNVNNTEVSKTRNRNYELLNRYRTDELEWYGQLGMITSKLEHLNEMELDSLDPLSELLWQFLVEFSASKSVRLLRIKNMDICQAGEFLDSMFGARGTTHLEFQNCKLCSEVGHHLGEGAPDSSDDTGRVVTFVQCDFSVMVTTDERLEFARGMAYIPGLLSLTFTRCQFSNEDYKRRLGILLEHELLDRVTVLFN